MAHISYKVTVWRNVSVDEDQLQRVKSEDDEINYDTEEEMTIEENDGCSTIELYSNRRRVLWENGKFGK